MFRHVGSLKIYSDQLCNAIESNDTAILENLLTGVELRAVRDSYNRTLLHLAAAYGNVDFTNQLIDAGCHIEACDIVGNRPLLVAAFFARHKTMQFLYSAGADLYVDNNHGRSALYYTRLFNMAHYLNMGWMNACIDTPARKRGFKRRLWQGKYKLEMWCDISPYSGIAETELVVMYGEQCYMIDKIGVSSLILEPLHMASMFFYNTESPVSQIFLATEVLHKVKDEVLTAVHMSAIMRNTETLQLLLLRNADLNTLDSSNRSPLVVLLTDVRRKLTAKAEARHRVAETIRLLFIYGARIDFSLMESLMYKLLKKQILNLPKSEQEEIWHDWFNYGAFGNVLKHLVHLHLERMITDKDFGRIRKVKQVEEIWQLCYKELLGMIQNEFIKEMSVYELLKLDITGMIRNSHLALCIQSAVEKLKNIYPLYYEFLKAKVENMIVIKNRMFDTTKTLLTILPIQNDIVVDKIARYLDLESLHILSLVNDDDV